MTKSGKHNHNWKGGKYIQGDGYIRILVKKTDVRHGVFKDRYGPEHVIKIENKIGRMVKKTEVVHHKNEIRHDNRLCNLQLMTRGEHAKHHNTGLKRSEEVKAMLSRISKGRRHGPNGGGWNHSVNKDMILSMILSRTSLNEMAKSCSMTRSGLSARMKYYNIFNLYQQLKRNEDMSNLNKVFLIGRLGQDVELRETANDKPVGNFNLATSEYRTVDGQKQESTHWSKVVVWDKTAENCAKYLHKGSKVFVEGRLQTRSYEVDGVKKWATEVVASNVQFLDNKPSGDAPAQSQPDAPAAAAPPLDEIPF